MVLRGEKRRLTARCCCARANTASSTMTGTGNRPTEWCLLRLWNFAREPRAFELRPPLDAHVTLIATSFEARFH